MVSAQVARGIAILALAVLASCVGLPAKRTVWVTVPLAQDQVEAGADEKVRVGEMVIVNTIDGKTYLFSTTEVAGAGLRGVDAEGRNYQVAPDELRALFVKRRRPTLK